MAKNKPNRAVPLPEAIDGRRWQITQSLSGRDAGISRRIGGAGGTMVVPMGIEETERLVRLHEMTHVKITPDDFEEVVMANDLPNELVQLCEDSRVHGQMGRLDFDTAPLVGVVSEFELKQMADRAHPAILAGLGAAMYATGEAAKLEEAIAGLPDPKAVEEKMGAFTYGLHMAYYRMHSPEQTTLPDFDDVLDMAREITEVLGRPDEPPKPPGQMPPPMAMEIPAWKLPELAHKREREQPKGSYDKPHGTELVWAHMTIEEPPRPLVLPGKMRGKRKKVPEQRGRRLHRIARLQHDGRVFAHKPPVRGGGAVLIDTSGSMHLTTMEVLQLCAAYPGGVIAAYSSDHGDTRGTLRVIARKGKRVQDHLIDPPGGGNGVDGPALDWLAKQPGPRFWISDAGVSGGQAGLKYCLNVCRRNAIKRVDNAWDLIGKNVG